MKRRKTVNDRFFDLMKKTGGRCWYCGAKKWPAASGRLEITADHVIPRREGGSDDIDNLVPCCRECNSSKCNRPIEALRHNLALRALGWPAFTREQIAWLRRRKFDLSKYDGFKFWFETHVSRHKGQRTHEEIDTVSTC